MKQSVDQWNKMRHALYSCKFVMLELSVLLNSILILLPVKLFVDLITEFCLFTILPVFSECCKINEARQEDKLEIKLYIYIYTYNV